MTDISTYNLLKVVVIRLITGLILSSFDNGIFTYFRNIKILLTKCYSNCISKLAEWVK